jgi:ribulose 1,5-bisphosphate synthetase/thiazole synthase
MSVLLSTYGSRAAELVAAARTTNHAVVIAGGGPTGLMLAGELALAGVDVAIVERRTSQDLAGSRAGGLHACTIEILDQRGIADPFLSEGKVAQVESACDPMLLPTNPPGNSSRLVARCDICEKERAARVNDCGKREQHRAVVQREL